MLILANFGEGHLKHFNIARKQIGKGMFVQSFKAIGLVGNYIDPLIF